MNGASTRDYLQQARGAPHWAALVAPRYTRQAMHNQGDKIRLIHECRTALLNRMFDELSRKPGSSAEQVSDEIIVLAQAIQSAPSESEAIGSLARGLFVLALQQVVDSFLAGLLTDEAFEWLAQEQQRADQILLEGSASGKHSEQMNLHTAQQLVGGKYEAPRTGKLLGDIVARKCR